MEIREIKNKSEWSNFLLQYSQKTFLQSWSWGEFNEKMGSKIWRLGAYQQGSLVSVALVIKVSARRGKFLFIPHGPVFPDNFSLRAKQETLKIFLDQLKGFAKNEGASFIRVAPISVNSKEQADVFYDLKFKRAPTHMHPEVTWELNIEKSEEALLKAMRKTTRYLIKKGQENQDIEIVKSDKIADLKLFWPVYLQTAHRQKFVVFPRSYLEKEFEVFSKDNEILIFLGKYKGEVVSAALFVFWQNICFYHHSGSNQKYSKIPISYLLMWEAIKEAKARQCNLFNFWGIAPDVVTNDDASKSSHPWAGLSLFKMGFGGERKEFVPTQDFIVSQKYWINYVIESVRKRKRNL